uniref:Similar to KAK (KAKTUS) n=1 Tax=Arundo donax TaxID=35708 RepID=A0A0A9EKN1_ARUDO
MTRKQRLRQQQLTVPMMAGFRPARRRAS